LKVHSTIVASTDHQFAAEDVGLACSLRGADRAERARWIESVMRRSLGVTPTEDGVLVRLPRDDQIEAKARSLAIAEEKCCPFLNVRVTRTDDVVHLTVSGPPAARKLIEAAFRWPHD
jgi:hypothetical protein